MTHTRDIEQQISEWLEDEAVNEVPDRVLSQTFEQTRELRQVRSLRWRINPMFRGFTALAAAGAAVAIVLVVGALALNFTNNRFGFGGPPPTPDQWSPFLGTWISTSDSDGGTQTMTVERSADRTVEVVVTDTIASVCDRTPSTMTGSGSVDGRRLVIPAPDYTCDDGSVPRQVDGGPEPINVILRDLTYILNTTNNTLAVGDDDVWTRPGVALATPSPTGEPSASTDMWPQSTVAEVREAQERADAGDPDYTWQVDPELVGDAEPWSSEILNRFVHEQLGWEEFRNGGGFAYGDNGSFYTELTIFRCVAGETNPLYPDDPKGRGCAPTINDSQYETVSLSLEQLARRAPDGVWVVTDWHSLQHRATPNLFEHLYPDFAGRQFEQVAPASGEEATTLVEAFLQARLDGEGAEQFVHRHAGEEPISHSETVPMLLYATTDGAPYERYEADLTHGPEWPAGWTEFKTRLFATDGTEVEQIFAVIRQEDGDLGLAYGYPTEGGSPTAENGQPVPIPYAFLDDAVTFAAGVQWSFEEGEAGTANGSTLAAYRGNPGHYELFELVADPRSVDTDCDTGSAPENAEALAQSILEDPDLDATAPVAVTVGGLDALQLDVVAAPNASGCGHGGTRVITDGGDSDWAPGWLGDEGGRMRLYLVDLPGGPAEILAIAVTAPEAGFDEVVEDATPIIDSIEFHAP